MGVWVIKASASTWAGHRHIGRRANPLLRWPAADDG